MINIKAAVLEDEKKLVYREDFPEPEVGKDDAKVKVHYCGICGSDLSNYKYKLYGFTPIIMGHEFSGEIVKLGENIKDFQVGDRVVGINVSLETTGGEMRGLGIFQNGGYAEYVIVNKNDLFKIPENLNFLEAVMIESFANSMRAMKLSEVKESEKMMIIGGGNIGLCTLCTLISERNPEYIVVIEPQEYLREKAKELGAIEAFPPRKNKIKKFIKNSGEPTTIFECAGNVNALNLAIGLIKKRGTILVEGIYRGTIDFPMMIINSKEIKIQGSLGHDKDDINDAIALVEKLKDKIIKFPKIVGSLKDAPKIFQEMILPKEREYIKAVLKII
ncbi:MAG: zinc-dependent alcohol dehydrogenase [Promethearchaeota archaeon]